MKKIILIIFLFPSISSYAQEVYQYESSKKNKILLNIADSSEVILTKKSKNRYIIISNKDEYVVSREKRLWHISNETANDTIGVIQYKDGFKLLINGETFTQETSKNEWIYFKDGQEVLKLNLEKKSRDKFISVQGNEGYPLLKLVALREAALKIEAKAKSPIIILGIAAAVLRALNNSGQF